ncbi:MAG: hypothetical protein Q7S09_03090 [bacterium]|nr:hypothetical protein [bacterium]
MERKPDVENEYAQYEKALREIKELLPLFLPNTDNFLTFNADRDRGTSSGDRVILGAIVANDVFSNELLPALRILAQTENDLMPLVQRAEESRDGRERWKIVLELKSRIK